MSGAGKALLWTMIAVLSLGLLGPWNAALVSRLQARPIAATVNGHTITQESFASAMRERLWRLGDSWESLTPEAANELRRQTLAHLIDCKLIPSPHASAPAKADEELHWFQRQLAFETERYSAALASQRLTEEELRERMEQQLHAGAYLDSLTTPSIDEGTVRAWFDKHQQDIKSPRVWRAAHLFLSSHDPSKPDRTEEIQHLSTLLISGVATFDELVAQHSEDERTRTRRGDLGWFGTSRMPSDFIRSIDPLRMGAISPPVKTKLGWHLIKLIDSKQARDLTLDEVREEITSHLRSEQRRLSLESMLAKQRSSAVIQRHEAVIDDTIPAP